MKNFNVDSVHDEKMRVIHNLILSITLSTMGESYIQNEDEMKGYIKALEWVMEEWE